MMSVEAGSAPAGASRSRADGRAPSRDTAPPQASRRLPIRAARTYRRILRKAALAPAFALMLALLEAFGFQEERFFVRFGFWTAMMGCWVLIFAAANLFCRPVLAGAPPQARRALAFTATALIMMVVASQGGAGWEAPREVVERFGQALLVGGVFELVCLTLLGGARTRPNLLAPPLRPSPAKPAPKAALPTPPPALPAILRRLPHHARGDILCLSMEDHYVRVHTTRGSALLLMRFSDAIAELETTPGLRVHRSWWVAAKAVAEVERSARSIKVRLVNDLRAPVSQPYVQALLQMTDMRPSPQGAAAPRPPAVPTADHRRAERVSVPG